MSPAGNVDKKKLDLNRKICDNAKLVNILFLIRKSAIDMNEKNNIEITTQANVGIVAFKAASISNADQIAVASDQIKDFIEENRPNRMIFDFEHVKFFSSKVLGMLLEIRARQGDYAGEVVISAINPQLYKIFKITNLDKIFKFFPDKNSAVKAVTAN